MSEPMDPFEAVLTMVRIKMLAKHLKRLANQLLDEPEFKTDEHLVAKYNAMVNAIDEFDEKLAHKD